MKFAEAMRAMAAARKANSEQLRALLGAAEQDEMITRNREEIPVIERGWLKRALFVAEPVVG